MPRGLRFLASRARARPFRWATALCSVLVVWGAAAASASGQASTWTLKPGPTYHGMCDASAAVAIDSERFAVANDEDNVLRIYHRDRPTEPLMTVDVSTHLEVDPAEPESDIEGACLLDGRIYWITSHGRNKKDKLRESRHRLFCTEVRGKGDSATLVGVGKVYQGLLEALVADARYAKYGLAGAAELAPKKEGGFNIEGLAATPGGQLLVAFRNPQPRGKALIARIDNPKEIIDDGADAKLGDPFELDLSDGGRPLGIRSIEWDTVGNRYWIVGGEYDGGNRFKLFEWSSRTGKQAVAVKTVDFGLLDFNPEAIFLYPGEKGRIQILSDDGTRKVDGKECKKLQDSSAQSFRSAYLESP
ncbi:MAG: DUF3616 domain-containing protein [Planctomycetota bacterium]|nr:MAG: DUF3616 domain-containing protein [Planctomycetota bacterium]